MTGHGTWILVERKTARKGETTTASAVRTTGNAVAMNALNYIPARRLNGPMTAVSCGKAVPGFDGLGGVSFQA